MEEHELNSYLKAGEIAKEVKKLANKIVRPGVELLEIAELLEGKMREMGAEPAFPINTSLNEIAAHYTPVPNDKRTAEGILKIDIGVVVDGYISDCAISFDLTDDKTFEKMIETNKAVLAAATKAVTVGVEVGDIGNAVSSELEKKNKEGNTDFTIIHGLCGHNLDKDTIHAGTTIPNYKNSNSKKLSGAFAIEPFLTTGSGEIYEGEGGGIYALQSDAPVRDRDARKILDYIKTNYKTRPFCARWLVSANFTKVGFALSILTKQGIIHHYPLLIEKTKAPVSQVENSFMIYDDKAVCFTA